MRTNLEVLSKDKELGEKGEQSQTSRKKLPELTGCPRISYPICFLAIALLDLIPMSSKFIHMKMYVLRTKISVHSLLTSKVDRI